MKIWQIWDGWISAIIVLSIYLCRNSRGRSSRILSLLSLAEAAKLKERKTFAWEATFISRGLRANANCKRRGSMRERTKGLFTHGLVPSGRKVVELLPGTARHPRGAWRLSRVTRRRPCFFFSSSWSPSEPLEKRRTRSQWPCRATGYLQLSKTEGITWEILRAVHVTHRSLPRGGR